MRILIVHQIFVDHKHPGGTRHLDIARCLVKAGHEVTIVASTVDYLTGRRIEHAREEVYEGIKIRRAYALPTVQRGLLWRLISYLTFIPFSAWTAWRTGPTDVVLGTTPPVFQLLMTWLIARARRVPFVLEVLDLWPDFAIGLGVLRNPLLIWIARKVEWFFYRRADWLVVNSPAYKDYLVEGGIPANRVAYIPMGVDLTLFRPDDPGTAVRTQWNLGDKFVATYAGALGIANDLDNILSAAERLRDDPAIHVLIVGGGKERARLEEVTRQKQLTNVTFGGAYPKDQINQVLAASNVCLATLRNIPQFRTPFPNKVLDYMAAGRPIILAIDGVIREVMEAAQAGIFVPPGDPDKLAAAIRALKNDPQRARQMGASGRKHIEENFHIQLQADRFEHVFRQVGGA